MTENIVGTSTPIALTIAGSDSGGGAGIQADLKAFSANRVFGTSAITALTAQNTRDVTAVHEVPADIVLAQIKTVLDDIDVQAIKIGMLFSPQIIAAVAKGLEDTTIPVVLDPVMVAKSGDVLLQTEAIAALTKQLFPRSLLITPNLPEAGRLLGTEPAQTSAEMETQAKALQALGAQAVLLKGGHGTGPVCTDLLLMPGTAPIWFKAKRKTTQNTHGTGCTYSAAIAAGLAKGQSLESAVQHAHSYLQAAIAAADQLHIGSGHGPVHHFHAMWS